MRHLLHVRLKQHERCKLSVFFFSEPDAHIVARCRNLVSHLETKEFENVLLVSHAGLIQVLMPLLCPKENSFLRYCDVVCLEFNNSTRQWTFMSIKG